MNSVKILEAHYNQEFQLCFSTKLYVLYWVLWPRLYTCGQS